MARAAWLIGSVMAAGSMVASLVSCGSPSHSNAVHGIRPKKGHVITNPTSAQAFIYHTQSVVREPNGDLLITDGGNWNRAGAKIVEMSPQGHPVWVYTGGLDFPHSAYPVGKNDILISDTNNNRVIMINRQGGTVWNTDTLGGGKGFLGKGRFSGGGRLLYPNDAVVEQGNQVLISSRFNNTVYEVTMKGKVTWSCSKFMFRQHRPRLLPNGNLIVADSDNARVLIINHACNKILFQYGDAPGESIIWPRSFNPYPGGNYIIGDSGHNRVIEINAHKQIVQQWTNLPSPYYVEVEKGGDMLLGDTNINGGVELSPHGGIAHQYPTVDPNHYPTSLVNGSFEQGLKGWIKGDLTTETLPPGHLPNMGVTSSTAQAGKHSAQITWLPNTPHLFLMFQQTVSVTPGRTYHFAGWIKTKNVQTCSGCDNGKGTSPNGEAYYYIAYVDPTRPSNPTPQGVGTGTVKGTTGWTSETSTFTPPAGVTRINIQAIMYGRGTAWFDNVALH